ncbi:DUF3500 domain-containing protein [Paraglaciecola sp.]|uniref:DUF3500 domain-containing protein n=2 Tax=Paraglaciecola sp. TaxID=1920173 RepID=UPI0032664B51
MFKLNPLDVKRVVKTTVLINASLIFLMTSCGSSDSSGTIDDFVETEIEDTESAYTYADCSALTVQVELMTCLAENLLSTLSTTEVDTMLNDLTETNATESWSNLPTGSFDYNGILIDDLSDDAQEAAEALLDEALSDQGNQTMEQIRLADEYLSTFDGNVYGEDNYAVAFLGEPSIDEPWIVEFAGHHYTFFASYNAEPVSLTPNFVAVEPVTWSDGDTTYSPMAQHQEALVALFDSLDSGQLVTALLPDAYDDVLVGPQDDGNYPDEQEGLIVADLSDAQKALVIAVIEAYAGDANGTGQSANYTSDEQLDLTYIAYGSYPDITTQESYARIDGPNIWIEFTVQGGVVFSDNHYHSIWRDKELDYGGNFDL